MGYLFHTDSSFHSCRTYIHDILECVLEGTGPVGKERLTGGIQGDDMVALWDIQQRSGISDKKQGNTYGSHTSDALAHRFYLFQIR